jgi:hypothetical protein
MATLETGRKAGPPYRKPQYAEASGATTLNRYFVVTRQTLFVQRNIVYLL